MQKCLSAVPSAERGLVGAEPGALAACVRGYSPSCRFFIIIIILTLFLQCCGNCLIHHCWWNLWEAQLVLLPAL